MEGHQSKRAVIKGGRTGILGGETPKTQRSSNRKKKQQTWMKNGG